MVAKLFIPSVRCPSCSHANDQDFSFCQRCGFFRKLKDKSSTRCKIPVVEIREIDSRLEQLMSFDRATNYSKQKDSLKRELEGFLSALSGYVTVETVTPRNLCRFLIFKDKDGKTQVHRNGCQFIGQKGKFGCGCPLRLSYIRLSTRI